MLRKAIALLKPHEESFAGDYFWNFRVGYAYYYLNQAGRTMPYFRTVLKAAPMTRIPKGCKKEIALSRFHMCFRERTKAAWDEFVNREAKLHQLLDQGSEDAAAGALADTLWQSTVWYLWWD